MFAPKKAPERRFFLMVEEQEKIVRCTFVGQTGLKNSNDKLKLVKKPRPQGLGFFLDSRGRAKSLFSELAQRTL
jgi:hypothetical protein